MFLHAYWSLGDNFDHLQYAYSERCDCISNETQFPPVVFWRLPFPRTGRGFRVFSVNKISGHIWDNATSEIYERGVNYLQELYRTLCDVSCTENVLSASTCAENMGAVRSLAV